MIEHHELQRAEDKEFKQQGRDLLRKRKLGRNDEDALEAGDDHAYAEKGTPAHAQSTMTSGQQSPVKYSNDLACIPPSDVADRLIASGEKRAARSTPTEAVNTTEVTCQ